ncbi:MAG: PepSY-associated TM helix domain-containing protein [Bacteroidota bacterium]|nr:PepSY-associated TM helix domain-containing protein [Bacteroidota bacterium]
MQLRKWLRILHRDIGYICTGLTVIYAISGIAVNHTHDWNPNYSKETIQSKITPVKDSIVDIKATSLKILSELGEKGQYKNSYQPDPENLQIFAEGNTINVNLPKGEVTQEKIKNRPILKASNFLHLNSAKKAWTWIADIFALSLAFLAISGLFMIKGKKGIRGRGAWLAALGFAIPLLFLLLYYF